VERNRVFSIFTIIVIGVIVVVIVVVVVTMHNVNDSSASRCGRFRKIVRFKNSFISMSLTSYEPSGIVISVLAK